MIGSPPRVEVDWFRSWIGADDHVPPGPPSAVALLHPGTRPSTDPDRPPFHGSREGWPGEEQLAGLEALLRATTDAGTPTVLASYDGVPEVPLAPPLDLAVRVSSVVDFLLVSGRLDELLPSAWEARIGAEQPVSALWPEDRKWCLYGDPDLAFTVLAGPGEMCERALATPTLAAVAWPHPRADGPAGHRAGPPR